LESISNVENGVQVDRFLFEVMIIWSAIHELEIEVLIQVYEAINLKRDGKLSWHIFYSTLQNLLGCSEALCMKEFLKSATIEDIISQESFVDATLNCRSVIQSDLHRKICFSANDDERKVLVKQKRMVDNLIGRAVDFLKARE
jgi:hypothetical protein